jgi:two-component system sensor histidine kinase RegB
LNQDSSADSASGKGPFGVLFTSALAASHPELATSVWLLHLRWIAVAGQLITISAAGFFFTTQLPVTTLLVLVGFTAATNTVYAVWLRGERSVARSRSTADNSEATGTGIIEGTALAASSAAAADLGDAESSASVDVAVTDAVPQPLAGSPAPSAPADVGNGGYKSSTKLAVATVLMVVDLITLTAMLSISGGVDNPFSSFYFVNLAVAGVLLKPRFAWSLAVLAIIGFSTLMFSQVSLDVLLPADPLRAVGIRHLGALIAFATCAMVVTYFVTSTARELTRRERDLRLAQAEQARGRQLESLSTLAAGAAHELATPMSTVLLIARELQHNLQSVDVPESVRHDLGLIDSELRHCRAILSRMRSAAGDHAGEQWKRLTVGELLDIVLEGVREPHRVDISSQTERVEDRWLWLPGEAVAQAVRNLIHNGLDASPDAKPVLVDIQITPESRLAICIQDWGQGMDHDVLDRIGQPFYTTKPPGRGMGLGLFLSTNVIRRLGGTIEFDSHPGKGTTATVTLPMVDGKRVASGE